MRLGLHVAVGQGLVKAAQNAHQLGCETIQIFSGNPRGWRNPAVDPSIGREFQAETHRLGIRPVVVHATYLINLASPAGDVFDKSVRAAVELTERASALGAALVVLHPGSHLGSGLDEGIRRLGAALAVVIAACPSGVQLLLENVAGGGSTIGGSFTELARVAEAAGEPGERLGLCLDTCHAWAAGYDLGGDDGWRQLREEVDALFGAGAIRAVHANDAMGERGRHLDRHTHVGQGTLGLGCFEAMMRAGFDSGLPCILETPKDTPEADLENLAVLRRLREGANSS